MSFKDSPRFIAFYSHKGGVGRSLALANSAYVLANRGRRVLIVDMDMEAPGQHMTDLFRPGERTKSWPGRGLLELLETWMEKAAEGGSFDFDLMDYLRRPLEEVGKSLAENGGSLSLLPAANDMDDTYPGRVRRFSWDEFYAKDGAALLNHLKHRFAAEGFDDVLIDSRTGASGEFYVSALELADTVVFVTGLNRQNIDGTRKAVDAIRSRRAREEFGVKRLLVVASPVPAIGADPIARRKAEIRAQAGFSEFSAELPYDPDLALEERIFAWERVSRDWDKPAYLAAINKLVTALESSTDPLMSVVEQPKATNPFALVRRDYIKDEDVVRFFVDPGGNILEDMAQFTPLVVTGARGSGKTMLASRFSLDVVLAEQRRRLSGTVDPGLVQQLGLYFRIDADFLDSFNQRDETLRPVFDRLFSLFIDIVVIRKALLALHALGGVGAWCDQERLFRSLFAEFAASPPHQADLSAFSDFLETQLTAIRLYLNNPRKVEPPILLSANSLMKRLMEELRRDGRFGERFFVILIDEYENYADYQQKIINTRLKQSRREDGVTYRLFMRSGGLVTRETLAPGQTVEEIHDYRRHSLDEELSFEEFRRHAQAVADRHLEQDPWFRANGYTQIETLFEDLSAEDEARILVDESRRKDELANWVREHFKDVAPQVLRWMKTESNPLRRAVVVVLLNQGKPASDVLAAFRADNKLARDWYHNYHRGALHWLCRLYHSDKRYAGLNQILGLAGNNIRVFLDFCHAIVAEWLSKEERRLPIAATIQDAAVHRQSRILRGNLYSAARSTREVNQLLERLGRLFELAHKSPRQSEPEINHFALQRGGLGESERPELERWLKDAWYEGVLRQMPGNKQKSLHELRGEDWQLVPWLVPLFGLSSRRKKKMLLSFDEVQVLFSGKDEEWRRLFNAKQKDFERLGAGVDPSGQSELW